MTDKEILEAAARAAGIDVKYAPGGNADGADVLRIVYKRDGYHDWLDREWNPLIDDGDALRLAVRLRFGIKDFTPCGSEQLGPEVHGMIEVWQQEDQDPIYVEWYKAGYDRYAATRRAIVRAAAEIGSLHNAEITGLSG